MNANAQTIYHLISDTKQEFRPNPVLSICLPFGSLCFSIAKTASVELPWGDALWLTGLLTVMTIVYVVYGYLNARAFRRLRHRAAYLALEAERTRLAVVTSRDLVRPTVGASTEELGSHIWQIMEISPDGEYSKVLFGAISMTKAFASMLHCELSRIHKHAIK